MASAAVGNTLTTVSDGLTDSAVTYSFGRPLSATTAEERPASTQENEVRKTIQFDSEQDAPRTTTLPLTVEEYFKPIKNWEGVVESVLAKSFIATMRDTDNPADRGEEQFEIDLEDVDPGDRDLALPGGIFYFTVGYRIRRGGTRIKGTQIVFRRMPLWSKNDIQRANVRARKFLEIMIGENGLERSA